MVEVLYPSSWTRKSWRSSPVTGKIDLALVYGSTREGRFCDTVANWAAERIVSSGAFALDLIDPASPESAASPTDRVSNLRTRISRADAIVVVTPEYNHGYPAPLKALIDSVNAEWQAKPVAFVPTAAFPAGYVQSNSCARCSPRCTRSPSGTA
jgi:NAD(P)H-dependent FMN reductase